MNKFPSFLFRNRIVNVYTEFLFDELLENEPNQSNPGVSNKNFKNEHMTVGQQLTSTTINPEQIHQMPIVLELANNQNVTSNSTTSAAFPPNDNKISEQIVNTVPLKQSLSSSVSSQVKFCQNFKQKLLAPNNRTTLSGTSASNEEREMKVEYDTIDESFIESKSNQNNQPSSTGDGELVTESTSANVVDAMKSEKTIETTELMANTNIQHTGIIDLTSDREETTSTIATNALDSANEVVTLSGVSQNQLKIESDSRKTSSQRIYVRAAEYCERWQDGDDEPLVAEEISSPQNIETIDLLSDQEEIENPDVKTASKRIENVDGQLQFLGFY